MALVVHACATIISAVQAAPAVGSPADPADELPSFAAWERQTQGSYSGRGRSAREMVYAENLAAIRAHNSQRPAPPWRMGVGPFTDLTAEEFAAGWLSSSVGGGDTPPAPQQWVQLSLPTVGANATIDWRTRGAVTPVKNQEHCGACWAFGTTGSIEGAHFLKTGRLVSLSEQQLIDCSLGDGNKGCKGGDAANSYRYIIANHGIDTEADYPYDIMGYDIKGATPVLPCNTTKAARHNVSIAASIRVPAGSEAQLAAAIMKTPVTVAVSANKLWQHYRGGVMPPSWCPPGSKTNHMILAVALSPDSYTVKNSWGGGWGEAGFARLARNQSGTSGGPCSIASQASYPVM